MEVTIKERVHELYWKHDINCARTMLTCLCELFHVNLEEQTFNSAIGLHGAGGFRAQCGLVEGALMFIGIYFSQKGKSDFDIASLCYHYANEFTQKYGSLKCYDLRPNGFSENDPPHACEKLTGLTIEFSSEFIKKQI
ncbi:Putative redox-active protein (C_GCAxxG_C_C) [Desulfosporosinus orientis DSM 765]|uniref:Putative redox-active protein (C_GCAxxG_C_C) n=1 Tax=Desulfosporosinus orientis (strain ATCC 19365 / DSM 765 / NCIMB 8382 / VKM B-1628 / Singapore I) TaxID=768706 RepID=G7WDC8_DESOD|nr:C-GCAxxG-C-C family protein [Desulfosporosinus orientis]AET67897.1 Putative redox-active protein (C_GCAxxG_C_C) [Desulfosporosinus orientis DSM 765]